MMPNPRTVFADLRREFFEDYLEREPEEATTLGSHAHDARLRRWSLEAISHEVRLWRRLRARLAVIEAGELGPDDALDHELLSRLSEFHLRIFDERQEHLFNIGASLYPYSLLQYQLPQAASTLAWARLIERIGEIPRFLREQERNLLTGASRRLFPARLHLERTIGALDEVAGFFDVTRLTQAAEGHLTGDLQRLLAEVAPAAAAAHSRHATFLRERILPDSTESWALGRSEYRWRLRNVIGVDSEPEQVAGEGRELLERVQRDMVIRAQALDAEVKDLPNAFGLLGRLRQRHPDDDRGILAMYSSLTERATAFVREHALFTIPGRLRLEIIPTPPGVGVAVAANWPAPLLDPTQDGHFLVSLSDGPAAHSYVDAASIAVHEGVPGHYLQSFVWQQAFSRSEAPIRFLLVADDVNVLRNHWGTNVNIEGFALYAEQLMLSRGFYSADEALGALAGQALRAARMVLDVGLHLGTTTLDGATEFLEREVLMSKAAARREAIRYTTISLQAITYMIGRLQIERLKEECRQRDGAAFSEVAFHDAFFGYGPVQPGLIARQMFNRKDVPGDG